MVRKGKKGIYTRKEEIISICRRFDCLLRKPPQNYAKSSLEFIGEFRNVSECMINIKKSVTFLRASNEYMKVKNEKTIPVANPQKREILISHLKNMYNLYML